MKFLRINSFDKEKKWRYVEEFLSHAGDSLLSFRYYNKRGKDVLEEHLHTVLLYDKEAIIGYGHLDKCDKGSVWLGICLVSNKRGKGIGKKIMANLVEYSDNIDNKVITILQFFGLRFLKQQVICEWVPIQIKTNDSNNYNWGVYLQMGGMESFFKHMCFFSFHYC